MRVAPFQYSSLCSMLKPKLCQRLVPTFVCLERGYCRSAVRFSDLPTHSHHRKTTAWNAPPGTTVALDVLGEQEVAEVVRLLNIPTADNWRGIDGASLAAATQSELEEEKGPNLSTIHSKKLLRAVKGYQAEGGVDMALIPNWAPGKAAA